LEFIADRAAEDISLQDIAFASGVSSRALHKSFRRFRDQTPMEYLRDVRLDYARAQLSKARQTGATVTQIAENCGFRHLGRFARAYLKRFGQLPSEAMIKVIRG
jgi:AraC-like DNA-binding protein